MGDLRYSKRVGYVYFHDVVSYACLGRCGVCKEGDLSAYCCLLALLTFDGYCCYEVKLNNILKIKMVFELLREHTSGLFHSSSLWLFATSESSDLESSYVTISSQLSLDPYLCNLPVLGDVSRGVACAVNYWDQITSRLVEVLTVSRSHGGDAMHTVNCLDRVQPMRPLDWQWS